jgi:hypothetical protein
MEKYDTNCVILSPIHLISHVLSLPGGWMQPCQLTPLKLALRGKHIWVIP